jgi:hypothetical protein
MNSEREVAPAGRGRGRGGGIAVLPEVSVKVLQVMSKYLLSASSCVITLLCSRLSRAE